MVTADDFGASPGVNQGVIRAHKTGIVTSASLMVYGRAVEDAAEHARRCTGLAVGLHLDIAEWEYVDGAWTATYERVSADDPEAVHGEVAAQLDRFERIVGRPPTHLDSHQHAHRADPLRSILVEVATTRNIPLRDYVGPAVYCGRFYGQSARGEPFPDGISLDSFIRILDELTDDVTELGCHPASVADLATAYGDERLDELAVLCDPRAREAIADRGIVLSSFSEITTG